MAETMPEHTTGWWQHGTAATAWFDATSLTAGAAFARSLVELAAGASIDVRSTGVRVRVEQAEQAEQEDPITTLAREHGMAPNLAPLRELSVVLEAQRPSAVRPFWQSVLGYAPTHGDGLADPSARDPALRIIRLDDHRPLRGRIHLDVVRPAAIADAARPGAPSGPYGVCHAGAEGNEVDLVPGSALAEGDAASDWHAVFSAVACYRTSRSHQRGLVTAAAELADDAGFPLLVDVRPGLVILDTGKDLWERDAHGLDLDFVDLAAAIQAVARETGAVADPALPRFVQLFFDAADVDAVRGFWAAALGYEPDRREGITDLVDPHRLGPPVVLQPIDLTETARREQRNRIHVELAVPAVSGERRLDGALAAGGRMVSEGPGRWHLADPEGNELVIVAS